VENITKCLRDSWKETAQD